MDDLFELMQLPFEAYPEYPAHLVALFRDSPLIMWAYVALAFPVAGLSVYFLSRRQMTFGRTFLQCAIVALVILPGAVGLGGLAFAPLALILVLAVAFLSPVWLLYNITLLVVAGVVAWAAATLVHRWQLRRSAGHVV